MIVVADTSPLNYLVQIGFIEVLQQMYGRILIPVEVLRELQREEAPDNVRTWFHDLPSWIIVRAAKPNSRLEMSDLDSGEKEAISLALEVNADFLVVDERRARTVATKLFGLEVIGTLGILRDAHVKGYLDGFSAFDLLHSRTNFRSTPQVRQAFLEILRS